MSARIQEAHILIGHTLCGGVERQRGLVTPAAGVFELQAMGERAAAVIAMTLSKQELMRRFCDLLQRGLPAATGKAAPLTAPGTSRR